MQCNYSWIVKSILLRQRLSIVSVNIYWYCIKWQLTFHDSVLLKKGAIEKMPTRNFGIIWNVIIVKLPARWGASAGSRQVAADGWETWSGDKGWVEECSLTADQSYFVTAFPTNQPFSLNWEVVNCQWCRKWTSTCSCWRQKRRNSQRRSRGWRLKER